MRKVRVAIESDLVVLVKVGETESLLDVVKKIHQQDAAKEYALQTFRFNDDSEVFLEQKVLNFSFKNLSKNFQNNTLIASTTPAAEAKFDLSLSIIKIAIIARWLTQCLRTPARKQVKDIINGHEKDLKGLYHHSREERKSFIEEVHQHQYKKIIERDNALLLALWARKWNKINSDQLHNIHELSEAIRHHGIGKVKIFKIKNSQGVLTKRTVQFLGELVKEKIPTSTSSFLPKILDPTGVTKSKSVQELIEKFISMVSKLVATLPAYANFQYQITTEISADNPTGDFHEFRSFFYNADNYDGFQNGHEIISNQFCPAAIEYLGSLVHKEKWWKIEIRLGEIKKLSGIEIPGLTKIRPKSVSTKGISLPKELDNFLVSEAGYGRHDEFHREMCTLYPPQVLNAASRINLILRDHFKVEWLKQVWDLIDLACSLEACKDSNLTRILSFFLSQDLGHNDASYLVVWAVVKDMVNHSELWIKHPGLGFDIFADDFVYSTQIKLHTHLMRIQEFSKLQEQQRIFVLQEIYSLIPANKNFPDYLDLWELLKKFKKIPQEHELINYKRTKGKYKNTFCFKERFELPIFPYGIALNYENFLEKLTKIFKVELKAIGKDFLIESLGGCNIDDLAMKFNQLFTGTSIKFSYYKKWALLISGMSPLNVYLLEFFEPKISEIFIPKKIAQPRTVLEIEIKEHSYHECAQFYLKKIELFKEGKEPVSVLSQSKTDDLIKYFKQMIADIGSTNPLLLSYTASFIFWTFMGIYKKAGLHKEAATLYIQARQDIKSQLTQLKITDDLFFKNGIFSKHSRADDLVAEPEILYYLPILFSTVDSASFKTENSEIKGPPCSPR